MVLRTVLIIVFGLLLKQAFGQDTKDETRLARIQFKELRYDFGDIKQGDKVSHTFEFTNSGNTPLVISEVKTTCGCTAPYWPREPIQPGASDKIEISFNSAGKSGKQHKVITVISNAATSPDKLSIVTNVMLPSG